MKRKSVRTLFVSLFLAAFAAMPALALFGIGDIVFDPTNFEQALRQYIQLQQQYDQLVRTYRTVVEQYDHMRRMAQRVPVDMRTRYRALPTTWRGSTATDTFGSTGGWVSSINSGYAADSGYARAIQKLERYGTALSTLSQEQQERVRADYATVELTDGVNIHVIETLGRLRSNAAGVERIIQSLEEDSLSSDPHMNTEIAVLNKINAAGVIALRNAQDTNQVLVSMAEAEVVDAKRIRDAEARAMNQHIRFRANGKAYLDGQAANASAAMMTWRMP